MRNNNTNARFTALLPTLAKANGKAPKFRAGDQKAFEALCESHSAPYVSKLWSLDLVQYRQDGHIILRASMVKDAASRFMAECKDCRYSRSYEIACFNEARQDFYSPIEAPIALNAGKQHSAQAILLAAYLTGTRLTSAQRRWLESAANGRYLTDKYSQYASGEHGTLMGKPVVKHGAYTGSEAQRQDFIEYGREARLGLSYNTYRPFMAVLNL